MAPHTIEENGTHNGTHNGTNGTNGTQNGAQNPFAWRQVGPLKYSRPLGDMDKAFVTLGGFGHKLDTECGTIDCVTSFTYQSTTQPDVAKAVREVWKYMRFEYSVLGAIVDRKNQTMDYYPITSDAELEEWTDKTFHVVKWPTFDAVSLPKPDVLPALYFSEKNAATHEYEIIPHSGHWRIDGFGGYQFLDRLFDHLSSGVRVTSIPSIQEQVEKLPITVEEMAKVPTTPSPEAVALVAKSSKLVSSHMPSVGMPLSHSPTALPGPVQNARVALSKEATIGLLKRCKIKGVRFNGALNAAFVLALRKLAPESHKNRDYVAFVPLSIRSILPPPYSGPDYCVSASVLPIPLVHPRGLGFNEMSENFQRACAVRILPEFLASVRLQAAAFEKAVGFQAPEEWGPNTTAFLNPLGDIGAFLRLERDTDIAKIHVTDAYPSTHIMAKEIPIYAYTFSGELTFMANYNEAYYSHDEVINLIQTFLATLDEQLK